MCFIIKEWIKIDMLKNEKNSLEYSTVNSRIWFVNLINPL